jgi:hypothetical protein
VSVNPAVRACLLALLSLTLLIASTPGGFASQPVVLAQPGPQTASPTPTPGPVLLAGSTITVTKALCTRIENNNNCNGPTDQSLDGYSIDYQLHEGTSPNGPLVGTITLTLKNGGGSEARDDSGQQVGSLFTVCELPVANPPTGSSGQPVPLTSVPAPVGSDQYVDRITRCAWSSRWAGGIRKSIL